MTKTYEDLEIEDVDDESFYLREISKLEKRLEIATKALEFYAELPTTGAEAREALKEMEGVT